MVCCQRSKAFPAHFKTVINNHIRLIRPDHLHQFFRMPPFPGHIPIGKVKPHHVQLPIFRTKLLHLSMQISKIPLKIPAFICFRFTVTHRMMPVSIVRIIRMMPVKQGIIQTNLQALCPERFQIFPYQIPSCFRVRGFKIRQLTVKQAEAVMVLRSQHRIFHSRFLRRFRPF